MAGMLPQYPAPPGSRNESVKTFAGPVLYATIVTGATPTGGIRINATDLGLVNIDQAKAWGDGTGLYGARVVFPAQPQGPVSYVLVQIYTLATGAEIAAINISASTFRIWAKQGS